MALSIEPCYDEIITPRCNIFISDCEIIKEDASWYAKRLYVLLLADNFFAFFEMLNFIIEISDPCGIWLQDVGFRLNQFISELLDIDFDCQLIQIRQFCRQSQNSNFE